MLAQLLAGVLARGGEEEAYEDAWHLPYGR